MFFLYFLLQSLDGYNTHFIYGPQKHWNFNSETSHCLYELHFNVFFITSSLSWWSSPMTMESQWRWTEPQWKSLCFSPPGFPSSLRKSTGGSRCLLRAGEQTFTYLWHVLFELCESELVYHIFPPGWIRISAWVMSVICEYATRNAGRLTGAGLQVSNAVVSKGYVCSLSVTWILRSLAQHFRGFRIKRLRRFLILINEDTMSYDTIEQHSEIIGQFHRQD